MVLVDLISKHLAFKGLFINIPIIGGQVKNPGITFGLLPGKLNIPVIGMGFLLIAGIIFFRYRYSDIKTDIMCALLAGGAMGNIYDRLRFGYVRDFIQWPTFNCADVFICAGVAFFIVDSIYQKEKRCEHGRGNIPSDT